MGEKEIFHRLIELNWEEGENLQEESQTINLFGKPPVLTDLNIAMLSGELLFLLESGAILLHLEKQYSQDIKTIELKL